MFGLSRAACPVMCSQRAQRARCHLCALPLNWRGGSLPSIYLGAYSRAVAFYLERRQPRAIKNKLRASQLPLMMHLMPTKNPRLTMTLTPTIAAQLRRLSELTGSSQASLISELLEGQEVVFARVIQALEAAALVKDEMKSSLREDLDRSQQVIEAQLGLVLESLDNAAAPLLTEAEKIRRRKVREPAAGMQAKRSRAAGSRTRSAAFLDPHLLPGGSKC